jgi:hypothetical protein
MGKEYIPIPRGSQSPDSHFIETTCRRSRIQASIQFDLFADFKRVPAALILPSLLGGDPAQLADSHGNVGM